MTAPPPSAAAQLEFLTKVQRVFSEGDFTSTYKYALLIVLADLAVEHGADDGEELALSIRLVAERFIDVYWQQAAPYLRDRPAASEALTEPIDAAAVSGAAEAALVKAHPDLLLKQNPGAQAAVLTEIYKFRQATGAATTTQARSSHWAAEYHSLLEEVTKTVSAQPVRYLQNLGGGTDAFLYYRTRGRIHLKPGVAYCLRRFQPLIQDVARSAWVQHIRGIHANQSLLGTANDLELFLFSSTRESLLRVRERLVELEGARCFYCASHRTELDVDHFLPFALYPRDLIHNFVLADPGCNRSKSDSLAARPHLERWSVRLSRLGAPLADIGNDVGITVDLEAHRRVARWAYTSARISGATAWLSRNHYQPVADEDLSILAS